MGPSNQTHWPLTGGELPLATFLQALSSVHYSGLLMLELEPERFAAHMDVRAAFLDSVALLACPPGATPEGVRSQNVEQETTMPTSITFRIGTLELTGTLNDSPTARAVAKQMPLKLRMARWGDEYYGSLPAPLGVAEAPNAREVMTVGELAYWPPGNALCLFFGPTPASTGPEPRAASPVNPVGEVQGDMAALKKLGRSVEATLIVGPPV